MNPQLEPNAVSELPSGLCACRVAGEQMHVYAVSPRSIWLRSTAEVLPEGEMQLFLYRPERGNYEVLIPENIQIGPTQQLNGAALTRFSFQDAKCTAAILRMLDAYARYVEIRSSYGADAYGEHICGYPLEADECFCTDLGAQWKAWADLLAPLPEPQEGVCIAVELNCPELWRLYLAHPIEDFMPAYAVCRKLDPAWLPDRPPERIYIGNACCRHLFPDADMLQAIRQKAQDEGLKLSLVTAELRSHSAELADRQIAFALQNGCELIVNDWGMLHRAARRLPTGKIVLGTILNRRRKDPRMAYKVGIEQHGELLGRNSLNDPDWIEYLKQAGIERFEFESCGLPMEVPAGRHSLHLPFYQTNTSLWCPTRALCLHGDRGRQADTAQCAHFCERNVLLYPAHLNMLGRWNSILALDASLAALKEAEHFDRWVFNF